MPKSEEEKRRSRISSMKRLIVAYLLLGILIPILLCILLFIKVDRLQKELDQMQRQIASQQSESTAGAEQTASAEADAEAGQQAGGMQADNSLAKWQAEETEPDDGQKRKVYLTFDDGPGEYTETLLDTVEKYNIHVTFFMLGQNVEGRESTVQRMLQLGCEIGNHTWDHPEQTLPNMDLDSVVQEFQKTDDELVKACGQAATVCRAPYGAITEEQMAAVGKPFFMWSTDSLDWKLMDADADYNEIMNSDLSDGSIILMHDIHEPSVKCATEKLIPELVNEGYKLVTVSELAAAKDVTLQSASYSDFWDSSLQAGRVAGYAGNSSDSTDSSDSSDGSITSDDSASADSTSADSTDVSDGSTDSTVSDGSDGSSDGSGDGSDGSTDGSRSRELR